MIRPMTESRADGPTRPLPDLRFHELVARRAADDPQAIAVQHAGRTWTYGELDARADRLARALLAHGLEPEGVVAVVTGRTPDWVAATLAVLRAGGCYLPVEPDLPPARVAPMLARAECRLALVEPGHHRLLASSPEVDAVRLDEAYAADHPTTDPMPTVSADGLAYLYFTSGSTGEPKGALCEHAGMLNHLLAKVEDLGIGAGDVVAQTAPRSFDISLWQACAPLLVGARTVLIEQDAILDAERFVATLAEERVTVAQLVPSYLDSVLAVLERRPRPLPDLRTLSVTGEPLTETLAERWFAVLPDVPLVNAYGLTETSDDTNHAVLRRAPARITVGTPIRNTTVSVVDELLVPVPRGTVGEVVFSGVCVGRGYVNDPERTSAAYLSNPHQPGGRRYRSGDFGRMLADGSLELLGRRDAQVKVRGFRIEPAEVEAALERTPGVRRGAVVVAHRSEPRARLVAFYTADGRAPEHLVRDRLLEVLPPHLVPDSCHRLDALPQTDNGKLDRAALTARAEAGPTRTADDRLSQTPSTPSERRLVAVWSAVLHTPPDEVGLHDHFFDRGGTSLSAARLVVALDREVSLEDVVRHPVLADLARLMDKQTQHGRSAG